MQNIRQNNFHLMYFLNLKLGAIMYIVRRERAKLDSFIVIKESKNNVSLVEEMF